MLIQKDKIYNILRRNFRMYMFNRITVNPQLPKRISKLSEIANNLWWSWNTEFLKIFKDFFILQPRHFCVCGCKRIQSQREVVRNRVLL